MTATDQYSVRLTRRALRDLGQLRKPVRRAVQTALLQLRDDPHPLVARALSGDSGTWHLTARGARVLYQVGPGADVLVLDVRSGLRRT